MKTPVIYTSVYGAYDSIMEAPFGSKYRHVCVTENPDLVKDKGWEIIYREPTESDNVRNAKFAKIHPHLFFPDNDVSLWMDTSMILVKDPEPILNSLQDQHEMAMFDHEAPHVNNIVEELEECKKHRASAGVELMTNQVNRYLEEGFPYKDYNHFQGMFIARRHHSENVINLMNCWWGEIKNNSYRDQLSFSYSCWKTNFNCSRIPAHPDEFFRNRPHGL